MNSIVLDGGATLLKLNPVKTRAIAAKAEAAGAKAEEAAKYLKHIHATAKALKEKALKENVILKTITIEEKTFTVGDIVEIKKDKLTNIQNEIVPKGYKEIKELGVITDIDPTKPDRKILIYFGYTDKNTVNYNTYRWFFPRFLEPLPKGTAEAAATEAPEAEAAAVPEPEAGAEAAEAAAVPEPEAGAEAAEAAEAAPVAEAATAVAVKPAVPEPEAAREAVEAAVVEAPVASAAPAARDKIPKGIINLGQSCFTNAVFQLLLDIDTFQTLLLIIKPDSLTPIKQEDIGEKNKAHNFTSFGDFIKNHQLSNYVGSFSICNDADITKARAGIGNIKTIFENLNSPGVKSPVHIDNYTVSLFEICKLGLKNDRTKRKQEDSSEMLNAILKFFLCFIKEEKIFEFFKSIYFIFTEKKECKNKKDNVKEIEDRSFLELFFNLNIDNSKGNNIQYYVDKYLESEEFSFNECPKYDEKPDNNTTKTTSLSFFKENKYIIIILKRFLDIDTKNITQIDANDVLNINGHKFNFKGCIYHVGKTRDSGHYQYLDRTHLFDDSTVSELNNTTREYKNNAYIYLYEREPTPVTAILEDTTLNTTVAGLAPPLLNASPPEAVVAASPPEAPVIEADNNPTITLEDNIKNLNLLCETFEKDSTFIHRFAKKILTYLNKPSEVIDHTVESKDEDEVKDEGEDEDEVEDEVEGEDESEDEDENTLLEKIKKEILELRKELEEQNKSKNIPIEVLTHLKNDLANYKKELDTLEKTTTQSSNASTETSNPSITTTNASTTTNGSTMTNASLGKDETLSIYKELSTLGFFQKMPDGTLQNSKASQDLFKEGFKLILTQKYGDKSNFDKILPEDWNDFFESVNSDFCRNSDGSFYKTCSGVTKLLSIAMSKDMSNDAKVSVVNTSATPLASTPPPTTSAAPATTSAPPAPPPAAPPTPPAPPAPPTPPAPPPATTGGMSKELYAIYLH